MDWTILTNINPIWIGIIILVFIGLVLKMGKKLLQICFQVIAIACGLKYLSVI